jgi:hypothetical protein
VFTLRELLEPLLVTTGAGFGRDRAQLVHIVSGFVAALMAVTTADIFCVVPADLPVGNNLASFFTMTVNAIIGGDNRTGEQENGRDEDGAGGN